jgi:hypothetical protein
VTAREIERERERERERESVSEGRRNKNVSLYQICDCVDVFMQPIYTHKKNKNLSKRHSAGEKKKGEGYILPLF